MDRLIDEVSEIDQSKISQAIREYFDNRMGQYPPIMKAEADFLAQLILTSVRIEASRMVS
jgi:hypothetical protein